MMEPWTLASSQKKFSDPFSFCKRLFHKRPIYTRHFPPRLNDSGLYASSQCVAYIHRRPMWQKGSTFRCALNIAYKSIPFVEYSNKVLVSPSRINLGGRKGKQKYFFVIGQSYVCRGLGEDTNSQHDPEENEPEPSEESNASKSHEDSGPGINKNDFSHIGSVESATSTDWRAFRARLISIEQQSDTISEAAGTSVEGSVKSSSDGRWAHPILTPEPGCVLIATEKLDGLSIFERTVILLLSDGLNGLSDGPFGLILNRPLPHTVKDMRPNDLALNEAFGNSQVHFGGPLISDLILLLHGINQAAHYQEVIPGVYFSPAEGLESAVKLVRDKKLHPQDIRLFFGYAGWALNQLKEEIENGYWYIAACSSDLFMLPTNTSLWEEILRIMGGKYAELSKKSKKKLQ